MDTNLWMTRGSAWLVMAGLWLTATGAAAQPAIFAPDGATLPFQDWTRGAAGAMYGEWDLFATPAGPNPPDVGYSGFADASQANVAEKTGTAFITSGGNIYSFAAATDFDVTFPGGGLGAGFNTRFVAQLVTLGSEVDLESLRLSYDGGAQELAALYSQELDRVALGGIGGEMVTTIFAWDIANFNPGDFLLEFHAAASSMSLANLVIDVYSQAGALTPIGSTPLPGDFDGSGVVDGDDYLRWKEDFSAGLADTTGYTVWRDNFSGGGSVAVSADAVPEPTTSWLMAGILSGWLVGGRRRASLG